MTAAEIHIARLSSRGNRRLYYYQGNFFHPIDLTGGEPGLVKRYIREFMRDNNKLVESDRADPAYRTPTQLADLQPPVM